MTLTKESLFSGSEWTEEGERAKLKFALVSFAGSFCCQDSLKLLSVGLAHQPFQQAFNLV